MFKVGVSYRILLQSLQIFIRFDFKEKDQGTYSLRVRQLIELHSRVSTGALEWGEKRLTGSLVVYHHDCDILSHNGVWRMNIKG